VITVSFFTRPSDILMSKTFLLICITSVSPNVA